MVSLVKAHYTNKGIKETKKLSINLVSEEMLKKADYVGSVSGSKVDKSDVFEYHIGDSGAPIINNAPVVMECSVEEYLCSRRKFGRARKNRLYQI